jgi:hypothetical protein
LIESTPLVGDPYKKRIETRATVMRIHTPRVFKLRTWLGIKIIRLALKIMGASAEIIE